MQPLQNNNPFLILFSLSLLLSVIGCTGGKVGTTVKGKAERPNILWITIEDWSPDLSCYGTPGIETPNVDKLASEGIRYETAFSTAPVCSPSRSAMMTGFHQNFIGANQHRTNDKQPLPYGIKPIPKLFEAAGYFTTLMSRKTDVNFQPSTREGLFMDTEDWSNRAKGQPFFARITFQDTHRKWRRDTIDPIATSEVELPPYYVDTEFARRDWANGLEQMQLVDREIGRLLKRLDDEGLADNTLVFFISDHGRCHFRDKQFLYEGGTRIPMVVRWPGKIKPGQVRQDLAYSIDLNATALAAAGIEAPVALHGQDLFGEEVKNRQFVFAARDKMDETHDAMRSVRSKTHKLILNLMPERPYLQFNSYKETSYPVLAEMNALYLEGKLTPAQAAFFANHKPDVELYDLKNDPFELNNLADDPAQAAVKRELMTALSDWRDNVIKDKGITPEFRGEGIFPATNIMASTDAWLAGHVGEYDYEVSGWPAWYPTRPLAEWKVIREQWEPWVFRAPGSAMKRPKIGVYNPKLDKKKSH